MKSFSPHLALFLLLFSTVVSPFPAQPVTYNMRVFSEMTPRLIIGCYGRGKFFGIKKIVWSYMYQFDLVVDPKIGAQNSAYCVMKAAPNFQGSFVVFDYERDVLICGQNKQCQWFVRPDGIYDYYNHTKNFVYKWK